MHHFGRNLTYTLLALIAALPLGSLAAGLAFGAASLWSDGAQPSASTALSSGLWMGAAAILFGIVPAALAGAPLYALLACRGWNNFITVTMISLLPGLIMVGFGSLWGLPMLVFGPPVAWCTHLIVRGRLQRNA